MFLDMINYYKCPRVVQLGCEEIQNYRVTKSVKRFETRCFTHHERSPEHLYEMIMENLDFGTRVKYEGISNSKLPNKAGSMELAGGIRWQNKRVRSKRWTKNERS